MPAFFKNILIPVDFSINTEVAIKKCLEIIEPFSSSITLFHIEKHSSGWHPRKLLQQLRSDSHPRYVISNNKQKLYQWQISVKENFPGIKVITDIVKASNIEKAIIEKARRENPDIIIIGKNCRHGHLAFLNTVSANRIAKKTGFPVLIAKPGSINNKTKSIVVPVGSFVPEKKMELILALRNKFRINIHLVTVMRNKQNANDFSGFALLKTYQFLKEVAHCPLDHEVLHGDNIARSTLRYAQQIKADMLVVDPASETRLASFFDKHISDELMPDSRLQILTVQS